MTVSPPVSPQKGAGIKIAGLMRGEIRKEGAGGGRRVDGIVRSGSFGRARTAPVRQGGPLSNLPVPKPPAYTLENGEPQVLAGPDRAINQLVRALRVRERRPHLHQDGRRIDLSRTDAYRLAIIWESLGELGKVEQIRALFLRPAAGLLFEPPVGQVQSLYRPGWEGEGQKEENALQIRKPDARVATFPPFSGARGERGRAYLVVAIEEGHLLYGRQAGRIAWEELDHASLMKVLGREMDKLSKLHGAGWEAGDTSVSNKLVTGKLEPYYISIAHLAPLDARTQGLPEVLSALASFAHDLSVQDLRRLIEIYLESDAGARGRAERYLRHRHFVSRHTRDKPYAPHTSLEDRLVTCVEQMTDAMHGPPKSAVPVQPEGEGTYAMPSAYRLVA